MKVVGVALATMLAAAIGAAGGWRSVAILRASFDGERKPPEAAPAPKQSGLRALKPIVTNLAAPPGIWVRLEAAIVLDGAESQAKSPDVERLAADIAADTMAYLRTLSLRQIEGADGLRHLREDLRERAAIRSGGRVSEIIIETLVAQ